MHQAAEFFGSSTPSRAVATESTEEELPGSELLLAWSYFSEPTTTQLVAMLGSHGCWGKKRSPPRALKSKLTRHPDFLNPSCLTPFFQGTVGTALTCWQLLHRNISNPLCAAYIVNKGSVTAYTEPHNIYE